MAHFYGNLKGSRGEATRCGTKSSGIRVSARSWSGSVSVEMDEPGAHTCVCIRVADGSLTGGRILFSGRLSTLLDAARLVAVEE